MGPAIEQEGSEANAWRAPSHISCFILFPFVRLTNRREGIIARASERGYGMRIPTAAFLRVRRLLWHNSMMIKKKVLGAFIGGVAGIWLLLVLLPGTRAVPFDGLNVLVIVVDTINSSHLGSYNPDRTNSPVIDALAGEGTRFSQAFSVTSWTKPAVASIYTSMLPSHHGATMVREPLSPEIKTMAEFFEEAGFRTVGFVSHSYLDESHGMSQGFREYTRINRVGDPHASLTSRELSDLAVSWLGSYKRDGGESPFFMLLHYFDPHFRYIHHPDFSLTENYSGALPENISVGALFKGRKTFSADDVEYIRNLYREEIAYTDHHIGRVVAALRDSGLAENTLIVLTSDHGEEFMEHRSFTHGRSIFDEVLRVPLIFHLPGRIKSNVIESPVDVLDILPTVMELACCSTADPKWEGRSLVPVLLGEEDSVPGRDLFSEISYVSLKGGKISPDLTAVRSGDFRLIHNRRRSTYKLFNVVNDPGEQVDVSTENPDVVEDLSLKVKFLDELHSRQGRALKNGSDAGKVKLPEGEVERLRSLGYF